MGRLSALLFLLACVQLVDAQYAPAAGEPGSTAIYYEDNRFMEWATDCTLERGWQQISDTTLGKVSVGNAAAAVGRAAENGIVSLGDGGTAILTFNEPIYNGDGFDSAVFENGFPTGDSTLAFLEFAFVEVSSDGQHFVRFPASSLIQATTQLPMVGIDAALVNNLAGKYTYGYGTPFDLNELRDSTGLDINHVTHVKLIDVVGSIDPAYGNHDAAGHLINDPYPTPYPSSGFDLDAVGVLHAIEISGVNELKREVVNVYPNPSQNGNWYIRTGIEKKGDVCLYNAAGQLVFNTSVTGEGAQQLPAVEAGFYLLTVQTSSGIYQIKLVAE